MSVFFHNLSNYDAHLIVKHLGLQPGKVKLLAQAEERYITSNIFTIGDRNIELRFLDLCRFLPYSVNELVSKLEPNKLIHTRKHIRTQDMNLLTRKSCFPYEHLTDESKFNTKQIPLQKYFNNSLNNTVCSDEECLR